MKKLLYLLSTMLFFSCSSTKVIDSWKSENFPKYKPKKILIVGISQSLTARKIFEEKLKKELVSRRVIAAESYNVFENSFKSSKQNEDEIEEQVKKLTSYGYDAILISAVKGVEEKSVNSRGYNIINNYGRHFKGDYYLYQDAYFEPRFDENYKVYNIESSLYNIDPDSEKSLVWVASYNIVDPQKIEKTVNDYVKVIVKSMEDQNLITKK